MRTNAGRPNAFALLIWTSVVHLCIAKLEESVQHRCVGSRPQADDYSTKLP